MNSGRFLTGSAIAVLLIFAPACTLMPPTSGVASAPASESAPPPLIAATLAGDLDRVQSLLDGGTDPNLVYHTNTALTYAARNGFNEIAAALIAAGAEVNWVDSEGVTPLILAAFKGRGELVKLLLKNGADPTVVDQWGRTALDYARRRGEDDAIAQLLQSSR
ncbi:MAG: ankyrin repeat domain-containing protein [Cyanobacteria bacterium P01_H01_bin.162]